MEMYKAKVLKVLPYHIFLLRLELVQDSQMNKLLQLLFWYISVVLWVIYLWSKRKNKESWEQLCHHTDQRISHTKEVKAKLYCAITFEVFVSKLWMLWMAVLISMMVTENKMINEWSLLWDRNIITLETS